MAYISREQLERALPDGGTLDALCRGDLRRADQAIETAQGEVDGYLLSGGYTVPLNPVPENVRNYTVDMAVWNLAVTSGFRDDAADEALKVKYEKALDFLKGVATGKYRVPVAAAGGEDEAAPPTAGIRVKGRKAVNLDGYWNGGV